ncbi:helix-turn-helix domain-containing protein [Clostridium felsineum]|uniref:helix-turn-helix domain-containing protein n=1 Tax=Clostridium felsineum TaxID=36839 RepID=UPI00214D8BB8|nr:helix-turn-helix transcriptional regulator [Clostridium felsineum]MCR3759210.1 helix-turn-helix domain-containing protein [Clostridium felsineum]
MTLKELRQKSFIQQQGVAIKLGISRQQYHKIEKGLATLDSKKLEELSNIFNKTPLEILKCWEESKNGARC